MITVPCNKYDVNFLYDGRRMKWWSLPDSNRSPSECKSDALPNELRPQKNGSTEEIRTLTALALNELPPTSWATVPCNDNYTRN